MKKMKKMLALLIASVLTLSISNMSVAAEDPSDVTVSLKSSAAPAVKGEIYEVTLNVSDAKIGGVQGSITYDAEKFELNQNGGVTVTEAFAIANRLSMGERTTMIKDDKAGTINFALLSDGTSTDWITFNFLVLGETGNANFTLSNMKVSNAAGTARIATVKTVDIKGVEIYDHAVDVKGASVRTNGSLDIRFEVEYDVAFAGEAKSVGLILIPTHFVEEGQELTDTTEAVYSGKKAKFAEVAITELGEDGILYVNLLNSAKESYLNTAYTARAFVRLANGKVIYSDNIVEANNIDNGMSSRSCVDVARAVANTEGFKHSEEVLAILAKTGNWELAEYEAVIKSNNENLMGSN